MEFPFVGLRMTGRERPTEYRQPNPQFATCWRPRGLKTVGEVREISDDTLLSFQDFGKGSVTLLRESLGLPSCDGVRSLGKSPPDCIFN
jgi:hypothetical protein